MGGLRAYRLKFVRPLSAHLRRIPWASTASDDTGLNSRWLPSI